MLPYVTVPDIVPVITVTLPLVKVPHIGLPLYWNDVKFTGLTAPGNPITLKFTLTNEPPP